MVVGALNVTAVPVSAMHQGAPVYGTMSVELAGTFNVAVVDVPAAVQVSVADVPDEDELATSRCQTRID